MSTEHGPDSNAEPNTPRALAERARVLAARGALIEAVECVVAAVTAAPELPGVAWLGEWLSPDAIRRVGLDGLKRPLVTLVKLWGALPPGLPKTDPRYGNVLATAELAALLRAQFPDEAPLYLAELVVRRRAGEPRDTLALAHAAAARFPSEWSVLVSAATAERDAHRPDESLAYARRALQQVPSVGSPLHDAALAFAEAGRGAEAVDLLRELLTDFPDYPLSDEAARLLQRAEQSP